MIFLKIKNELNISQMDSEIKEIECVNFGVFSAEDVLKISVAKIDSTKLYGHGSVYDDRLGINSENYDKNCITCSLDSKMCPGHFGHIELNEPIIHPRYFKMVLSYLKCFCIKCHSILFDKSQLQISGLHKYKRNIRFDKIIEKLKKIELCFSCNALQPKITYGIQDGIIKTTYKHDSQTIDIPLSVQEIMKIFENATDENIETLGFNPKLIKPGNLIITHLLVLPPCARPVVVADTTLPINTLKL